VEVGKTIVESIESKHSEFSVFGEALLLDLRVFPKTAPRSKNLPTKVVISVNFSQFRARPNKSECSAEPLHNGPFGSGFCLAFSCASSFEIALELLPAAVATGDNGLRPAPRWC